MKKWYVVIAAALLLCHSLPVYAADTVSDGRYTVEAVLTGGSGRAGIESPVDVRVENGILTATVIWSSPFYEYMLVDGVQYDPIQAEGNATFEIPAVLDEDIPVRALTVAMSEPHLIDYTIHFDSTTLRSAAEQSPSLSLLAAGGILTVCAALAIIRKKARPRKEEMVQQ